jgi:hypothetical protein
MVERVPPDFGVIKQMYLTNHKAVQLCHSSVHIHSLQANHVLLHVFAALEVLKVQIKPSAKSISNG